MRTELGKIKEAYFGLGGYQGAHIGVWFQLGGTGWGVGDGSGTWANRSDGAKWSIHDQREAFADSVEYVRDLLKDANVESVAALVGTPVEVSFDGMILKSWRILKEVL
jgi:hypothetical protein